MNWIWACLAAVMLATPAAAQKKITTTIQVWGNCGMCKTNIEKAAKGPGVIYAVWDKQTDLLTVTYQPKKVTLRQIQERIAAAGYDTKDVEANQAAYDALTPCCQYNRRSGQPGTQSKH